MAKLQGRTPYERGYNTGNLPDSELEYFGHTRESYAKFAEDEFTPELSKAANPPNQIEFFHGLLDGARDLRKK